MTVSAPISRSPRRALALGAGVLAFALVAGCGGSGASDDGVTSDAPPLPAEAPEGPLLCGMVPESSVETALGRTELLAEGELRHDETSDHVYGRCRISAGEGTQPLMVVSLGWPVAGAAEMVERARRSQDNDFVFPKTETPAGVANYGFGDGGRDEAAATMIWGDYVPSVGIEDAGQGRDPLDDAVALTRQVVDALTLPKQPTDAAAQEPRRER